MNYKLDNKNLIIYFEGELNSSNSLLVDKEVDEIIKKNQFEELTLDFQNLSYISSAGLRVVLKLKQQYSSTCIVNASLSVYEILEMTGFTNMMNIKKALKEIDITGAKVIGEGYTATVYRLDQDTIIKVYNENISNEDIERELKLAKEAFILGIPTAISFDIVKVGNKLGTRFEMLDCDMLRNIFLKKDIDYDSLLKRYVSLLKKINTTECFDEEVPQMKEVYLNKYEVVKEFLTEEESLRLKKILEGIPLTNTFIHGDCHFKNIMVQDDNFLLIDMDTLSKGHFIFELAALMVPYVAFELDWPGNNLSFLGLDAPFCTKLYNDLIDGYLGEVSQEKKDKIALICFMHMVWWNRKYEPQNEVQFNGNLSRLKDLLAKYDNVNLGE